ncbi:TPA: hypothetical protein N0F65_009973 [Lagenidium giganteum]|uniref:Uncharacterized protein n=1 Tax=Lagenidium giganteum TaxID=4803 RepID=A0AAV2YRC1_9STRA|nr:TPA: hypothetical protein N0F65_009973 [Lagenidium giganteum]
MDDEHDSEYEIEEEELDLSSNPSDVESCHAVDSPSDDALAPEALRSKTTQLINDNPCQAKCLTGKARAIELFLNSIKGMSKDQLRVSLISVLSTTAHMDPKRCRGNGERERFPFFLPLIGEVCREAFLSCFGTSARTVARLRKQIDDGNFGLQAHGGSRNKNARKVGAEHLSDWFQAFAQEVVECVPVRMRAQKTINGVRYRTTTTENHVVLPSYFTWHQLCDEYSGYVTNETPDDGKEKMRVPSEATLRAILQRRCPHIQIRSSRDHACDTYAIYANAIRRSRGDISSAALLTETMELIGKHGECLLVPT